VHMCELLCGVTAVCVEELAGDFAFKMEAKKETVRVLEGLRADVDRVKALAKQKLFTGHDVLDRRDIEVSPGGGGRCDVGMVGCGLVGGRHIRWKMVGDGSWEMGGGRWELK
jgi:hypothetical protein